MPHTELIRLLLANPKDQAPASEFISRYEAVIRQAAAQLIYKEKFCYKAVDLMIDDAVSETFFRLVQNDCQALRAFKGQYENSIFSYLRAVTFTVVRNQLRLHRRRNAFGQMYSLDALAAKQNGGLAYGDSAPYHSDLMELRLAKRQFLEEKIRRGFRRRFRGAHVNRNFIIFKLRFLYDYHNHEIARIKGLGLTERGVNNTTDRIRQCLREKSAKLIGLT
jgi:hypothetical protein